MFKASRRGRGWTEDKRVIRGEKRLGRTLLCEADHHELLADVSTAVHRDEKLPDILLHRVGLLGEEHSRLCGGEERMSGGGGESRGGTKIKGL